MFNNDEEYEDVFAYYNSIKSFEPLSREREKELAIRIQNGDKDAINELVIANLKYVVTVAKTYTWSGLPLYDLISEGNQGLFKAATMFNPNYGTKFITYASRWIRIYIRTYISSCNIDKEFTHMDDYIFSEDTENRYDMGTDFDDSGTENDNRVSAIEELLTCLDERETKILKAYFGIGGEKECTLDEIGNNIGLTQERVRQIKEEGLEKLRFKAMTNERYAEFKELY